MPYTITMLCMLAIVCAKTVGAPVPKQPVKTKDHMYFPTSVESKLVYQFGDEKRTDVVTAVEEKNGVLIVSYKTLDASGKILELGKKTVSEQGLFSVPEKEGDDPYPILKLPFKKGDSWPHPNDTSFLSRYVGEERVKVCAGEFETIRVWFGDIRGETLREEWYAPRVGLVKIVTLGKTTYELISFTPGKG